MKRGRFADQLIMRILLGYRREGSGLSRWQRGGSKGEGAIGKKLGTGEGAMRKKQGRGSNEGEVKEREQ